MSTGFAVNPPDPGVVASFAPSPQRNAPRETFTRFLAEAPTTQEQAGISSTLIEDLFLRHVYLKRCNTISALSESMALAYPIVEKVFREVRGQRLLEVSGMVGDDYVFSLTSAGRATAGERCHVCQYAGPAPVSLRAYQKSVLDQRPQVAVNRASLRLAFGDLVVTDRLLDQLGPALAAQNSIFLYGPAGTGKSSLAERLLRVYEDQLVIPYAIEVDNQIIVLFDPAVHERVEFDMDGYDPRWMVCHRPCVIVGGELVPSMLELRLDDTSGTYAPPVQMKANGGILVIDDFGRQLISPRDLLNRWIVPLDRRVDYLSLQYGVKFQIPFEVMVVFATNLDPNDLADEAFLRRIHNKIFIEPVHPHTFDEIFRRVASSRNVALEHDSCENLRKLCLSDGRTELRACYPLDIINILSSIGRYEKRAVTVTKDDLQRAVGLYFAKA